MLRGPPMGRSIHWDCKERKIITESGESNNHLNKVDAELSGGPLYPIHEALVMKGPPTGIFKSNLSSSV